MSQKYPGGIISTTAPVTVGPVDGEGGSAPGVWTLEQALALQKQGLWPKPVSLGPRAVGWPAREVAALNEARIAGWSDAKIRALVLELVDQRTAGAAR